MTPQSMKRQASIFLDRDGTLVHDLGYLCRPEEVVFFEYTVSALRRLQSHYSLFIVTSQSGISKGLQTHEQVARVNRFIEEYLETEGVIIRKTYTCPHHRTDGCRCHKPDPYFAIQAAEEFGLDLQQSFMIGDHPHDAAFGVRFGGVGLYVLTGHGKRHQAELDDGILVFPDLAEAACWILEHRLGEGVQ